MEGYTGNIAVVYTALAVCGYVMVWAIKTGTSSKSKIEMFLCLGLALLGLWCLMAVFNECKIGYRPYQSYPIIQEAATEEDITELLKSHDYKKSQGVPPGEPTPLELEFMGD